MRGGVAGAGMKWVRVYVWIRPRHSAAGGSPPTYGTLATPDLYANKSAELAGIIMRRADATKQLAEAEERWLSLSAEYEEALGAA